MLRLQHLNRMLTVFSGTSVMCPVGQQAVSGSCYTTSSQYGQLFASTWTSDFTGWSCVGEYPAQLYTAAVCCDRIISAGMQPSAKLA